MWSRVLLSFESESSHQVDSRVGSFRLWFVRLFGDTQELVEAARASCAREVEGISMCFVSLVVHDSTNLDQHIAALHDKIRNFVCEVCRMTFTQLGSLRTHEQSKKHKIRLISVNVDDDNLSYYGRPRLLQIEQPELYCSALALATASSIVKQYECNRCDKSYDTKTGLRLHIESIHLAIRYRCENCPSTFISKGNLARHLRKVCARKPLKCDRCRKRFPKYDWYVEHRQWHIKTDLDRFFKWYGLYA